MIGIKDQMEFQWDGSCLGEWKDVTIYEEKSLGGKTYHFIKVSEYSTQIVQTKSANTPYACLVDEMKTYFGLPKQGTHWLKSGQSVKIIVRVANLGRQIVTYPTLKGFIGMYKRGEMIPLSRISQFETDFPELTDRIRISWAFRIIFGIRRTNQSSLIIKWFNPSSDQKPEISDRWMSQEEPDKKDWIFYPISIDEINPSDYDRESYLPDVIYETWFKDKLVPEVLREMCMIRELDHVQPFLLKTQNKLDETINRIDNSLVSYISEIIFRLSTRVSDELKATSKQMVPPKMGRTKRRHILKQHKNISI